MTLATTSRVFFFENKPCSQLPLHLLVYGDLRDTSFLSTHFGVRATDKVLLILNHTVDKPYYL